MAACYRILIVEDNPHEARLIELLLGEAGSVRFAAERVERVAAALERLDETSFDLILLDLSLPDSHGLATFGKIYERCCTTPVIVLSGLDDEELALCAVQNGAQDYLVKDADLDKLLVRSIRYALERFRAGERLRRNEQHLRLLNEQLPAYFWTTDLALNVQSASASGVPGFLPGADGWLGICLELAATDDSRPLIDAHWKSVAGESVQFEYRLGSRVFHVQVEPFRNQDGRVTGTIGLALDVTDQALIELELRLTRTIQEGLLPAGPPSHPCLDMAGVSQACAEAGGDYYDYVTFPDGDLGIVMCDVGGHGLGPALLMAQTRAYLRALTLSDDDPGAIVTKVNHFLCADTSEQRLVALFLAKINGQTRQLRYAGAGHRSYLLRDGEPWAELSPSGIPLNIAAEMEIQTAEPIPLRSGDVLLLFTDGIVECPGIDDLPFGLNRMLEVVQQYRDLPAAEILKRLFEAVECHGGSQSPEDDMTALVVKVR